MRRYLGAFGQRKREGDGVLPIPGIFQKETGFLRVLDLYVGDYPFSEAPHPKIPG
jgi:hypothetical protein